MSKIEPQAVCMNSPVVFVTDKNPIHSSLIKYHLNVNRFSNVHTFQSGEECLYRIRKNTLPDFLITDYHVGDHTGFEFLKTVRTLSPETCVIFFSAYDDPILAVRLLDSGATDYIVKTSKLEYGISELVKNLKFLVRSNQSAINLR